MCDLKNTYKCFSKYKTQLFLVWLVLCVVPCTNTYLDPT